MGQVAGGPCRAALLPWPIPVNGATMLAAGCDFPRAVLFQPHGQAEARRQEPMSAHKFKIGQVVTYNPRRPSGHPGGVYQIAQLMPPMGDEPQYRIKSEAEGHLRACRPSNATDSHHARA